MYLLFTVVLTMMTEYSASLLCSYDGSNYKAYDDTVQTCCNGTIYNKEIYLCCGNVVVNKTGSGTLSCNDTLEQKTKNISKMASNGSHSGGVVTTNGEFNNGSADPVPGISKGKILLCGVTSESRLYNDAKETCCNGTVFNKTEGVLCCTGKYNPETPSWRCCGARMVNYDVFGCCGAGNPYNKRNEQCCGGKIASLKDKCCADQVLDTKTQVCCSNNPLTNETIIQKKRPYHDKCCPSLDGGNSYDSTHFACRWKSKVVPICPKECKRNGTILLENFCKNSFNGIKPKVFKKGKLMRRIIRKKSNKICQCIYRSRKKGLCDLKDVNIEKKCKLVGISVVKEGRKGKNRSLFMYYPRERKFLKRNCGIFFSKQK